MIQVLCTQTNNKLLLRKSLEFRLRQTEEARKKIDLLIITAVVMRHLTVYYILKL